MKHLTITKLENNSKLIIKIEKKFVKVDIIRVSCSCYYTLFVDGKIVDFGPERTAKGYTRIKEVEVFSRVNEIKFVCLYYGIPSYDFEMQDFFFGVEVESEGEIIFETLDFGVYKKEEYLSQSCKFSFQRGFVERYDLNKEGIVELNFVKTNNPIELESAGQTCDYKLESFSKVRRGKFLGFETVLPLWYMNLDFIKIYNLVPVREELLEFSQNCYFEEYSLQKNKTGLIKVEVLNAKGDEKIYVVFDELLPNDKWVLGRTTCNDILEITLKSGYNSIITCVPYTLQHVLALTKNQNLEFKFSIIKIENDRVVIEKQGTFKRAAAGGAVCGGK